MAIFIKILVAIILAIFFFQLAIHGDFFPPPGDGHKKKVEALIHTHSLKATVCVCVVKESTDGSIDANKNKGGGREAVHAWFHTYKGQKP